MKIILAREEIRESQKCINYKGIKQRNRCSHLFAAIAGQIKRENREKRYSHAGDDDVHRVEEGLSSHRDVERDVQVRLIAAGVKFLVSGERKSA